MGLYPKDAIYSAVLTGLPIGPNSNIYIVDPLAGSDSNTGDDFKHPLATIATAFAKCTTNQNDVVLLVGGPTANLQTTSLLWNKDYTHLVGMSGDLPGVGQRCRITSAVDATIVAMMNISGNGCIFKNLNVQNETSADADSGALIVSGMRNYFKNCFASGMVHATPAARAAAYSMTLSGPENYFEDCAFGVQTINRTAANAEVIITGSNVKRNHFNSCEFLSQSVTAGKVLVRIVAGSIVWSQTFEDCSFLNWNSAAGETGAFINHAIEDGQTGFHQTFLRGLTTALGCTQLVDVATFTWTHGAAVGGAVAPIALNNLTT